MPRYPLSLIHLLDTIGYGRLNQSPRQLDRIRYTLNRYLKKNQLARAQQAYKDAVMLLRDVAMGSVTHRQLQSMRSEIDRIRSSNGEDESGNADQSPVTGSQDFLFNATIIAGSEDKPRYIIARGLFDTGSDIDLISQRFVQRAGLSELVKTVDRPEKFECLAGVAFSPAANIELTWYLNNSSFTRSTKFCLVADDSFDILLGKGFIEVNNILKAQPKVRMMRRIHSWRPQKPEPRIVDKRRRLNILGLTDLAVERQDWQTDQQSGINADRIMAHVQPQPPQPTPGKSASLESGTERSRTLIGSDTSASTLRPRMRPRTSTTSIVNSPRIIQVLPKRSSWNEKFSMKPAFDKMKDKTKQLGMGGPSSGGPTRPQDQNDTNPSSHKAKEE